jgi:hypothetical protein
MPVCILYLWYRELEVDLSSVLPVFAVPAGAAGRADRQRGAEQA